MEVRDEALNYLLCMTCLCVGRTLRKIGDEKLKQYYLDILNEIPLCIMPQIVPVVCWECEATIVKILSFKEQVKDSYRILQTYTKENLHECLTSEVGRPSRLKVHKIDSIDVKPHEEPENTDLLTGVKEEDKRSRRDSNSSQECKGDVDMVTVLCEDKNKQNIHRGLVSGVERVTTGEGRRHRLKEVGAELHEVKVETNGDPRPRPMPTADVVSALCGGQRKHAKRSRKRENHPKREREIHKREMESGVDVCVEELDVDKRELVQSAAEVKPASPEADDDTFAEDNCFGSDVDVSDGEVEERSGQRRGKRSAKMEVAAAANGTTGDDKEVKTKLKIKTLELSYEDLQAERTRLAERRSFVRARHKCRSCLAVFSGPAAQKTHDRNKHAPELGEFICPICYVILGNVESFTAHYRVHIRRYECNVCQKRTADIKTMNRHVYSRHEKARGFKCEKNAKDTHRHEGPRQQGRVQCADCDKTFSHRAGLMNHRLTVHELQNEFPCGVCKKVFRWKNSLKRHLEKHQTKVPSEGADKAYCDACDVGFSSVSSLQRHLRNSLKHVTQDQLKFTCDHCGKRFADKTKLRNHIEEKHLHWTYACQICNKPSKNRVGLEQHIRNVHKGRPNNKICHHCGKGFPTKVQLESHIRTHTGERPFICEFCPTTFSQQSNLYKHHRQVHLNIKSKRYPMCKKRRGDGVDAADHPPGAPVPTALSALVTPPLVYYTPDNGLGM